MTDPKPPPTDRPASWFFGAALMALGALMVVLCGLCSVVGFFAGAGMVSETGRGGVAAFVQSGALVLVFGGIPILIGVGLFLVGRNLCRQR
jgi:hypothetical protein